ncbi:TPA: hypothetical protein ACG3RE_003883 [Clostridioides difficile]
MRYYERTTEMKKRRGFYSETDLYQYQQSFRYTGDDWNYVGTFERSNIKDIFIEKNVGRYLLTRNVYRTSYSDNRKETVTDLEMKQLLNITFIKDPIINLTLSNISKGCTIDYNIVDNEPTEKFIVTEKLNNTVIATKPNSVGGNYSITLTDEQILPLQVNSQNNIIIEISTEQGGLITRKTVTFTRTKNKPIISINSYNSNSAKFKVSGLDNNLSKIEWFIDDVLKETITTDLTTEKTINYELTDNAIHTLKIVATDAENATAEKVLSISKEIMPLQSDASLSDISTKLTEIGEEFRNGKISIINTLALKNIDASLNNTLVELSEKVKNSFDSSDASVLQLQNRITELTNQLSQRAKFAKGNLVTGATRCPITIPMNLDFIPKIIIVRNLVLKDSDNLEMMKIPIFDSISDKQYVLAQINGERRVVMTIRMTNISKSSFTIECSVISGLIGSAYITFGSVVWWSAFDTF